MGNTGSHNHGANGGGGGTGGTGPGPSSGEGSYHRSGQLRLGPASSLPTTPTSTDRSGGPPSPSGPPLPPIESTFVDSGYLLPLSNIYPSSAQDWVHPVVQHLILQRKLAPFYRGLEDWDESWSAPRVCEALRESRRSRVAAVKQLEASERAEKEEAERAGAGRRAGKAVEGVGVDAQGKRAVAAAVGWGVRQEEGERYVGEAVECPLCFLYYPRNINLSRCCQQAICTECFVQIKRAEPTAQELKSEPVCCPYCVESHFGVTYEPPAPAQRSGWESVFPDGTMRASPGPATPNDCSAVPSAAGTPTSPSAPAPAAAPFVEQKRRRQSTSHTSKEVVTTDAIQPDWRAKLEAVKAAVQRRANRRIIFRQDGDRLIPVGVTSSRDPSGSAFLAALEAASQRGGGAGASAGGPGPGDEEGRFSRRSRRQRNQEGNGSAGGNGQPYGMDLEELMIMEAMRRSLLEEEERQKKEKAEREKAEKEAKKAGKSSNGAAKRASGSGSDEGLAAGSSSAAFMEPAGRGAAARAGPGSPTTLSNSGVVRPSPSGSVSLGPGGSVGRGLAAAGLSAAGPGLGGGRGAVPASVAGEGEGRSQHSPMSASTLASASTSAPPLSSSPPSRSASKPRLDRAESSVSSVFAPDGVGRYGQRRDSEYEDFGEYQQLMGDAVSSLGGRVGMAADADDGDDDDNDDAGEVGYGIGARRPVAYLEDLGMGGSVATPAPRRMSGRRGPAPTS